MSRMFKAQKKSYAAMTSRTSHSGSPPIPCSATRVARAYAIPLRPPTFRNMFITAKRQVRQDHLLSSQNLCGSPFCFKQFAREINRPPPALRPGG
jgi:hypothetical protein